MRAVWLREFGPPSALETGDAPEPAGDAVIEVAYANITFVETQVRAGRAPFPVTLPMIPGNGVGGFLDGRRVVASLGGSGGYAERAAGVDRFDVPQHRTLEEAVALLADGRTATMLAEAAAITPGDRVLVLAAAGGVGTLLVQLAAAAGAHVIAVASTDAKRDLARSLGADDAVGYTKIKGLALYVSVVFDGVGGSAARDAFERLEPGGRMLSYGLASGEWAPVNEADAAARGVTLLSPRPVREHTVRALEGQLKPVIGQRFPLERAGDAHAAIEARATVGKTLLVVQGE
jgi:NADPH2:quinone reductase